MSKDDETELPICTVSGYASPTLPGHLMLGDCVVCALPVYATPPTVIDSSNKPASFGFVHYSCERLDR